MKALILRTLSYHQSKALGVKYITIMASQKGHYVLPQRVALESNALL